MVQGQHTHSGKAEKMVVPMESPVVSVFEDQMTVWSDYYTKQLRPIHEKYTTEISVNSCSLEYAVALCCLASMPSIQSVADLGSGFTTFALRWLDNQRRLRKPITTYDDSLKWIQKTQMFTALQGVITGPMRLWSMDNPPKLKVDLVSFDISVTKRRPQYMLPAFEMAQKGLLVDDVHKKYLVYELNRKLSEFGRPYEWIDLKPWTLDSLGRYAALIWWIE